MREKDCKMFTRRRFALWTQQYHQQEQWGNLLTNLNKTTILQHGLQKT